MSETPAAVDFVLLVFALAAMATVFLFAVAAVIAWAWDLIRWGLKW